MRRGLLTASLFFVFTLVVFGQKSTSSLPLLRSKFVADSVELPKPVGMGLAFLAMRQHYEMKDLKINGESVDFFRVNKAYGNDAIVMPRVDVWLLPFLNLYAFAGAINGELDMNVHVRDPDLTEVEFDLPLNFQYTGAYYGLGTSVMIAHRSLFTMLDGNYAKAKLDNLDAELIMYMTSARFGYISQTKNKYMLWIGTMYQDVDQTLNQVSDGNNVQARVKIRDPMNLLIGARYVFHRFAIVGEVGGLGREQVLVSAEYRF